MGKGWDGLGVAFDPETWRRCYDVLKPGGHLIAFGGSRTWHRMAVAIEDAGFEMRDSIAWLYGSGFPKSMDVSKAIDKQRTEDRTPTDIIRTWLNEQCVAAGITFKQINEHFGRATNGGGRASLWTTNPSNRQLPSWDEWVALTSLIGFTDGQALFGGIGDGQNTVGARADQTFGGEGGPSRFFPVFKYQAKAPAKERPKVDGVAHPTVKPLALMRWLVKLVCPPGGTVIDPFAGSGTTIEAALAEGMQVVGIEYTAEYLPLIMARIERTTK